MIPYLTPSEKHWICDIEGDPIPSTRIWCFVAKNVKTRKVFSSTDQKEIKAFVDSIIRTNSFLVGHNFIGYDAPTLNRLLGTKLTIKNIVDTMLLSMMYSPSIQGGHSLDSWGKRLKVYKQSFTDFEKFSPEMLEYCKQDVEVTYSLYLTLCRLMQKHEYSAKGIEIEHRSWQLIQKQRKNGFAFNYSGALELFSHLRERQEKIEKRIYEIWPPTLQLIRTYKNPYRKDGEPSKFFQSHSAQYEKVVVSPDKKTYDCYGNVAFNIGSPDQRNEKLLEMGWKPLPNELTPTGLPRPFVKGKLVPSLERFLATNNAGEGPELIAEWLNTSYLANMINTWMESFNDSTGCIHGQLWLANTLRYRHSNPNTANIPAVRLDPETGKPLLGEKGKFQYEARNLWVTRDPLKRVLVGVDAKGIQLRVLAHYLNNPEFTEAVVYGSPHDYNQKIGGFPTRDMAKTFIYAFLLGAGDAKVGEIIGGSPKDGKELKEQFIVNFPGLEQLLNRLQGEVERTNRITLIDGTSLVVNQPHTRLGYLLQGDENRIMKQAAILADLLIRRRRLDVLKVGDIHDEWQNDVLKEHSQEFAFEVCPIAFKKAGELMNYGVPIECDAKIGMTWAETH